MPKDLPRPVGNDDLPGEFFRGDQPNVLCNLPDSAMDTTADIEDFPFDVFCRCMHQKVNRLAVVFHKNKIPRSRSIAVNTQRLLQKDTSQKSRDKFFEMLSGAVVVERPNNYGRDPVRREI